MKKKTTTRGWVYAPSKTVSATPSDDVKKVVDDFFVPIIAALKKHYVKENPNKEWSYLADVYSKWYRNFFYLCEKRVRENEGMPNMESEEKFLRLKVVGGGKYEFAYFRHTGQWWVVAEGITLEECKEMIGSNPNFHPMS